MSDTYEIEAGTAVLLDDLPSEVADNLSTLSSRLNNYLAFYSALNLNRLAKLYQFIKEAEEVLYAREEVFSLSTDELMARYSSAKRAALEVLELARKVAYQSRNIEDAKVDEIHQYLTTLSPSTLEEFLNKMEKES